MYTCTQNYFIQSLTKTRTDMKLPLWVLISLFPQLNMSLLEKSDTWVLLGNCALTVLSVQCSDCTDLQFSHCVTIQFTVWLSYFSALMIKNVGVLSSNGLGPETVLNWPWIQQWWQREGKARIKKTLRSMPLWDNVTRQINCNIY